MNWFKRWFDPNWVPDGNPRALMKMARTAKDPRRRRRAVYALGWVPISDEVLAFLRAQLDDPGLAGAAIHSMGRNSDPRGKEIAEKIARAGAQERPPQASPFT